MQAADTRFDTAPSAHKITPRDKSQMAYFSLALVDRFIADHRTEFVQGTLADGVDHFSARIEVMVANKAIAEEGIWKFSSIQRRIRLVALPAEPGKKGQVCADLFLVPHEIFALAKRGMGAMQLRRIAQRRLVDGIARRGDLARTDWRYIGSPEVRTVRGTREALESIFMVFPDKEKVMMRWPHRGSVAKRSVFRRSIQCFHVRRRMPRAGRERLAAMSAVASLRVADLACTYSAFRRSGRPACPLRVASE